MEEHYCGKTNLATGTEEDDRQWFRYLCLEDLWLPTTPARPANGNGLNSDPNLSVHHLIDYDTQTWILEILHEFVDPADIPIILSIHISKT